MVAGSLILYRIIIGNQQFIDVSQFSFHYKIICKYTIGLHPGQRLQNHTNLTIRKIVTQMLFHHAKTLPAFIIKGLLDSSNLIFVNKIINA